MNQEEARNELNRRLNILNSKSVPTINKRDLRGGMSNINQRKNIVNFSRNIEREKVNTLNLLNNLDNQIFSAMSGESGEQEINLDMFKEPSMNKLRKSKGRGYFW